MSDETRADEGQWEQPICRQVTLGPAGAIVRSLANKTVKHGGTADAKGMWCLVCTVSFLASASASAQTIDVRTVTCKEAAALPDGTLGLLAVWLDGFLADDDNAEDQKVDLAAAEDDAEEIKAYCTKHPALPLLQAMEQLEE